MQDVDRDAKESPSLWDHWQRNNVLLLLAGWVCLGGSVWAGVSGRECLGGWVCLPAPQDYKRLVSTRLFQKGTFWENDFV